MTDDNLPQFARDAVRQFTEGLAELRTARIRLANQIPPRDTTDMPDREPPEDRLRALACSADAPAPLARIAHAVHTGQTSWAAVVRGDADHLPDVADLKAQARKVVQHLNAMATREAPAARQDPARQDDGDLFTGGILRRANE